MAQAQPIKALTIVLEKHFSAQLSVPVSAKPNIGFLNASTPEHFQQITSSKLVDFFESTIYEQPSRHHYLTLKKAGYNVHPVLPASVQQLSFCIISAGKFRALNEAMLVKAQNLTCDGGTIIVTGEKMSGIASLRNRIKGKVTDLESLSKHHSIVFWFSNRASQPLNMQDPLQFKIERSETSFQTGPGLFSADKVDQGSALLSDYFKNISGSVADLGAGWGYLSWRLISLQNTVAKIDLYESEYQGVQASQKNLRQYDEQLPIQYFWHDVCNEPIQTRYDQVIMNPPFHQGLDLRVDLGQKFIEKAATILKPRGKLLMVANQHLAYEKPMSHLFSRVKTLITANGFKVISAQK